MGSCDVSDGPSCHQRHRHHGPTLWYTHCMCDTSQNKSVRKRLSACQMVMLCHTKRDVVRTSHKHLANSFALTSKISNMVLLYTLDVRGRGGGAAGEGSGPFRG